MRHVLRREHVQNCPIQILYTYICTIIECIELCALLQVLLESCNPALGTRFLITPPVGNPRGTFTMIEFEPFTHGESLV